MIFETVFGVVELNYETGEVLLDDVPNTNKDVKLIAKYMFEYGKISPDIDLVTFSTNMEIKKYSEIPKPRENEITYLFLDSDGNNISAFHKGDFIVGYIRADIVDELKEIFGEIKLWHRYENKSKISLCLAPSVITQTYDRESIDNILRCVKI